MDVFNDLPKELIYYSLTSILGSTVGVVFGFFWKEKIVPFLSDMSEGTKIYSNWKGSIVLRSDKIWDSTISIKKSGKKISGNLYLLSGESAGKIYTIVGRFDYGILTLLYFPDKGTSKAQGTATFTLVDDGEKMEGYFAFGTDNRSVGSASAIFEPMR